MKGVLHLDVINQKSVYAHVLLFNEFSNLFVKLLYASVLLPSKRSKQFESLPIWRNINLTKSVFVWLQIAMSNESCRKASARPTI